MLYDLKTKIGQTQFKARCNQLYLAGAVVELTNKKARTPQQNKYLHLILSWFAASYGCPMEFAKVRYFKDICNHEMFAVETVCKFTGEVVKGFASITEKTSAELTLAIERFRNWSASTEPGHPGLYLPEPKELDYLQEIEIELSKFENKLYL